MAHFLTTKESVIVEVLNILLHSRRIIKKNLSGLVKIVTYEYEHKKIYVSEFKLACQLSIKDFNK